MDQDFKQENKDDVVQTMKAKNLSPVSKVGHWRMLKNMGRKISPLSL